MHWDDPEKRIADLERQLAEPGAGGNSGPNRVPEETGGWLTAEQVHNAAFSKPAAGRPGYNEDEVDAFLERVEAALREPVRRLLTPEQVRGVAFSKPPIGKRGYSEDEVDAFLDRVDKQLTAQQVGAAAPIAEPGQPTRCVLNSLRGSTWWKPVLAIDVGKDAIRVIDMNDNALIASVPLAEVTAKPAQHSGIPVLVMDGPGLPTLTIQPHPPPGEWRKRPESKKPDYVAVEEEWLTLANNFGLAQDLVEEATPQNVREHVLAFANELNSSDRTTATWRKALVLAVGAFFLAACFPSSFPLTIPVGVGLLVLAALAWRFNWQL